MSEQDAPEPEDSETGGTDADADASEQSDSTDGEASAAPETPFDLTAELDAETAETPEDLVDETFVEQVAEADPEAVAAELAELRLRTATLESDLDEREERLDDVEEHLARTKADFQNYKKRMKKRREEEKQRATEDLVERLLDVRDNLARALEQDEDADIRDGIEATLRQFDDELDRENVAVIEPEPGQEVDPQRHEVLLRVESDQPDGTVADLHRPGYEMAGKVIRTAQVTVSDGPETDGDDGDGNDEAADGAGGE